MSIVPLLITFFSFRSKDPIIGELKKNFQNEFYLQQMEKNLFVEHSGPILVFSRKIPANVFFIDTRINIRALLFFNELLIRVFINEKKL